MMKNTVMFNVICQFVKVLFICEVIDLAVKLYLHKKDLQERKRDIRQN